MRDFDKYFLSQQEPAKSCLLALCDLILEFDSRISSDWKYRMPFFTVKGKMFCYLWVDKITKEPYIGIVKGMQLNDPELELGNRTHIKIFRINPCEDIPTEKILSILKKALRFYI